MLNIAGPHEQLCTLAKRYCINVVYKPNDGTASDPFVPGHKYPPAMNRNSMKIRFRAQTSMHAARGKRHRVLTTMDSATQMV